MKGMLSKAFSLALLISVVPSFAALPDVKATQEAVSPEAAMLIGAVEKVVEVGDKVVESNSLEATAKSAVVSGIVVPSAWEKAKAFASSASDYVANSRVAGYATSAAQSVGGYAHSALVAPFNYTLGYLANKSGLADRVSNIGFVKNDSYYSTTIGKYAFGLAAMYASYRAVKAAYGYATTPATQKAEAVRATQVLAPVNPVVAAPSQTVEANKTAAKAIAEAAKSKVETKATVEAEKATPAVVAPAQAVVAKPAFVCPEHEQVVKALEAVFAKVTEGTSAVAKSKEWLALSKLSFMQELIPLKSGAKSYEQIVLGHLVGIDYARTSTMNNLEKRVSDFASVVVKINKNAEAFYAKQPKEVTPGYATRAYNALVNRRTLIGGATVAGLAAYGYKYGIPFYNTAK